MQRIHCSVKGLVQGVGFRWFVKEAADERGLTGWVRNMRDGSVEFEVQSEDEEVLRHFVRAIKRGPRVASVESLYEEQTEPVEDEKEFRIRKD